MTAHPGDLLEYAARRAGPGADGHAIAAAVGLERAELVALVTARAPIALDRAAAIARSAGADPADIWPDWHPTEGPVVEAIDAAAVAVHRSRGARVLVAIGRYGGDYRVDAFTRNGDPVNLAEWKQHRYATPDEALAAARSRYGDRIRRVYIDDRPAEELTR
jgi:hypothetical protein